MNATQHQQLQQASTDGLRGYFFYEAGGFPLAVCSYRLSDSQPPQMPTREMFEQRLPVMPLGERKAKIDRLMAEAEKWYPCALDAYSRAPYRVTVRVPGDNGPHVLEYINAERFCARSEYYWRAPIAEDGTFISTAMRLSDSAVRIAHLMGE